jgi:DNA repair exonuclease SbcCD ATPase subunit
MRFPKLTIQNFLTIGSAEIELEDRGLLLIQGVNESDTSASSNGAGKSSLADALCWCIYGETARGLSGDKVVNNKAKKDCMVATQIVDENLEYTVTRYRKHTAGKNMLTVHQRDMTTGASTDLSKGTDKETQEIVNKIMGCSLEVFMGAIYAGQEKMPDLPGMTDKNLKMLVEEAAGTEELAEAYAEARTRALKAEAEYNVAATHAKSVEQRAKQAQEELIEAEEQVALFNDNRKARARAKLEPVAGEQAIIADRTSALAGCLTEEFLDKEKAKLQLQIDGRKAEETKLKALQAEERALGEKETRFRQSVEQLKAARALAQKNLADVDKQVGTPCNECGKPYHEHDLADARVLREKAIASRTEDLAEYVRQAKEAITARQAKALEVTTFEAGMTDVSAVVKEINGINESLLLIAKLKREIETATKAIDAHKAAAKECLVEPNPWEKVRDTRAATLKRCTDVTAQALEDSLKVENKLHMHKHAVEVFGPAGVRAHILDTVTPYLNERTSDYLGTLSDGNISATWSTLAKNAKGEIKEKFNIEVTHLEGGDSFDALSGGEKRKVRLAANLALQDLKALSATKPINLWIGDEIDHALDEPGLERLMTLLDRKAKERGTVVVISHMSLKDWIDNVITVTKNGKVSTVSGATHRGL